MTGNATAALREATPVAAHQAPPAAATTKDDIDGRATVCVVDDDDLVCQSMTVLLETQGFAVFPYASGAQFLGDARRNRAKCLIVDQHMPGMNGFDVLAALDREHADLPAILVTGRLDAGTAERARELGVRAILEKPFRAARLVEMIRGALDLRG
ncbi:MAG TPA: response regulator [Stellaceae bacterium]|nr:response regulator [Stellaceae bacterium]